MAGAIAPGFWQVDADFVQSEPSRRLAEALGCSYHSAAMYRALLYGWAVKAFVPPDGNVSDFRPRAIESACLWNGERNALYSALCTSGILLGDPDDENNPLVICNWEILAHHILKWRKGNKDRVDKFRKKGSGKNHPPCDGVTDDVTDDVTRYATPPISENNNYKHRTEEELRIEKTEADSKGPSPPARSNNDSDLNGNKGMHERFQHAVQYARENIAVFTDRNEKDVMDCVFFKGIYPELVEHAVDEACASSKSDTWDYCHKILQAYAENGVKTLEQAQERERQYRAEKKPKDKPTPKVRFIT